MWSSGSRGLESEPEPEPQRTAAGTSAVAWRNVVIRSKASQGFRGHSPVFSAAHSGSDRASEPDRARRLAARRSGFTPPASDESVEIRRTERRAGGVTAVFPPPSEPRNVGRGQCSLQGTVSVAVDRQTDWLSFVSEAVWQARSAQCDTSARHPSVCSSRSLTSDRPNTYSCGDSYPATLSCGDRETGSDHWS